MSIFSFSKDTFDGEYPEEKVILLLRRHWFVLVPAGVLIFILILAPFAACLFFRISLDTLGLTSLYWFGVAVYFIFLWQITFYRLTMYLLDVWIVTDRRIIDSQQKGFFSRVVSETKINKVQDVSTEVHGLIPTFLNFGNVEVQTAGTEEKFVFRQVPAPEEVRKAVMQASSNFSSLHHEAV